MFDGYLMLAFAGYLALMLFVGFFFSRRQENLGDYYLGGRRMNKWIVAFSAQASDMSGWLLMGLPGAVYVGGLSAAWIGVGLLLGSYLNWRLVARRLRVASQTFGDAITIPDFISNRFGDRTGIARVCAALIILVFFTFYTASGFVSCAKLFNATFGVPYVPALWIGAAVVIGYTLLGGYMAVCWTDFIQGTLMFVAIVLVPTAVVCDVGGISAALTGLRNVNPHLLSSFVDASTGRGVGLIGLASCLAWGLGYFGMPHILVRFMSIDRPDETAGARRIAMTWVVISMAAAVAIGLVFHLHLQQRGLTLADVGGDPEKGFMVMIDGLFRGGFLVRVLAGLLLSSILAAIMSTADSQLLVSASSFSCDLYRVVFRKKASDRELLLVSRLAVGAVALVAILMASNRESAFFEYVMKMVSFAWAGFGAAFGPLILLSLYWRRTTLAGAVSGMVVGAVTCFLWKFVPSEAYLSAHPDSILHLYELAPGFILSFVTTVVVSLLRPQHSTSSVSPVILCG